ncbi:two-component system sensor histidine kinase NtrB [Thiobacillus sedimenti]|uniref:histidine kinase n=1 Tax=Thiobacillus sedimenti TaxID=3110231 RepID=A0ABZ1CGI5_9PROT|nr:HAMP domain-containing sensor histidine kinase [Thiobacillus sp. SCUT-2]WRS38347.1 HAMP domain-containing sensor histidine kinase [Thiobacillus sp. SCUT-2]
MNAPAAALPRPPSPGYFASHWRSLDYFNLYRLTLAVALVFSGLLFGGSDLFRAGEGERFQGYAYTYLVIAALFVLGIRARWPGFQIQLTAHIATDIVVVMLLMTTSSQLAGGMGLLLAISVASGGLVGSGRLTLLYAAMASIAVLLQHGFSILGGREVADSFFQVGLLCAGYFAIGLLAHALTQRALRSERLAQQQSDELALLNRINALAIENSPDGLLAVRGDGVVRHASPRALALLGVTTPVVPGTTRLADCAPDLARLAEQVRPGTEASLTAPAAQLRVRCIPLATPDDSRVLVLEDQTQAAQAAQRLKLAALGRLTANIAHEIRNPLSAISHAAQLLREEAHDPAGTRLAGIIENNARRLDRLVEEVLTLNRRDRLNPATFDAAALAGLVDELRQAEEIPADAVIVSMPDTLRFQFDPDHLRQIVWNLMRNAWRYSRKQPGSLHVSAQTSGDTVQIDLADDGPGLAAEHLGKLFEPFFTTDAQGTGLGLFLARELAEANRARLAYVPGTGGARFRLSLGGSD